MRFRHTVVALFLSGFLGGILVAADPDKIAIYIDGHVEKPGDYLIDKRVKQNLDELIKMAGGFAPLEEFKHETTSSVAWIDRDSPEAKDQHIIIDYQNKRILSQRLVDGGKCRPERYDWDAFEYLPGDVLFVTTSRGSLDLAFIPTQYVQDDGWKGFEKLRYFGKTFEETQAIDKIKSRPK